MTINPYVKAWILLSLLYDQTLRCVCVLCMRRLSLPRKKQFEAPDTFTKSYFLCKYLLIAVHRSHSDTHHFLCVLLLLICFGTIPVHLLPRASLLAFDSKQYASYVDDRDRVVEITILPRDTLSYSSILLKTDALTSIWFSRASWKVHWNIECLWKFHNIVKIFLHILHLAPMTTSSTALRLVSKTREWKVKSDFIGSSTIRVIERTRWHTEEESAWNAFATVTAKQKFTG